MESGLCIKDSLHEVERAINYIHTLTISYISSNKHNDKFKKYLEKESKKNEQTNGSDPNTNIVKIINPSV